MGNQTQHVRRAIIPRQDRYENRENHLVAFVDGKEHEILNYSRFGIALAKKKTDLAFPQQLQIEIKCGGDLVYAGRGFVVNSRADIQPGVDMIGVSIQGEIIIEHVLGSIDAIEMGRAISHSVSAKNKLDAHFVAAVEGLGFVLSAGRRRILQKEKDIENIALDFRSEYTRAFRQKISEKFATEVKEKLAKLNEALQQIKWRSDNSYENFARDRLFPLVSESAFVSRAYEMPIQHPGDYELINMALRSDFEGSTLFGSVLNKILLESLGSAYLYQAQWFTQFLRMIAEKDQTSQVRVLFLSPGPGNVVQSVLQDLDNKLLQRMQIDLIDIDERPLMHSQVKINRILHKDRKKTSLKYVRAHPSSDKSIPAPLDSIVHGLDDLTGNDKYDAVVVPFIYNYLSHKQTHDVVKTLSNHLSGTGEIAVGYYSPSAESLAFLWKILDPHWQCKKEDDASLVLEGIQTNMMRKDEIHSRIIVLSKN